MRTQGRKQQQQQQQQKQEQQRKKLQLEIHHHRERTENNNASHEKTLTTKTPSPKLTSITSCKGAPANSSGVYLISDNNNNSAPFKVYCEMEKFEGGWTVVQHRFNGSVDFYRNWDEYREGFGQLDSEFWLGLERMHQLTTARPHELIVEIRDFEGNYGYARYSAFQVGSESEEYSLKTLGSYYGTAGDSMTEDNMGESFTTKDRQNNSEPAYRWAVDCAGAWWYGSLGGFANLNGRYQNATDMKSIWWYFFKTDMRGLSFTRMMIREK
ncbi:fibrinogen-like protein A [Anopheles darlingi]|uniref:fibrinogen-like protein A n=1 Tax=Anopheles darlingi TaxID=43151 RepID=UPI0021002898|nr:fibrinogen-like protein A [Anopheles darlingi]